MQLELNNDEVYIVMKALDFYSRIWTGQYSEIENLLRFFESNCTVNFNTPILKGNLPVIKCECKKRKTETVLIVEGMESNFCLIERSLNVFICLVEYKIGELFQYYTDDKKALALAKEIENMYMRQDRGREKNTYLCEMEMLKMKVEKLCTFSEKKVQ